MASKNIITDLGIKELISKIKTSLSTKSDTSHTHDVATISSNGFLSSSDKLKLDNMVKATVEVKLPVSDWSSTSPYT
jgi:exonuclease I